METKLPKIRGRVWLGARLVLVALGTLAAAGAGVYGVTGNHNATQVQLTAWYSEGASAAANATASGRPGSGQISQHAVNYAHEMSTAFHNAAESALPSVVMVLNMPAEAKATVERKRTPNDNSEETPFGFQGTPFGDLFRTIPICGGSSASLHTARRLKRRGTAQSALARASSSIRAASS